MKFTFSFAATLALLPLLTAAVEVDPVETNRKCVTGYGNTKLASIPEKTWTKSYTTFRTITHRKFPTTTLTPLAKTVKETRIKLVTSTKTLKRVTDTFKTTKTFFTTRVRTKEATKTKTRTVTTSTTTRTSTVTIQASPLFTPITSDGDGSRKRSEEEVSVNYGRFERSMNHIPLLSPAEMRVKYATTIICNERITYTLRRDTTEVGLRTSTKTLPRKTVTDTVTKTSTSIFKKLPRDASTTLTFSRTATSTKTRTTTVTKVKVSTTTDVIRAEATHYAACDPSNRRVVGEGHAFRRNGNVQQLFSKDSNTAYECCVQCIEAGGSSCALSFWYENGGFCAFLRNDKCNAATNKPGEYQFIKGGNNPITLMNSNCGQWQRLS